MRFFLSFFCLLLITVLSAAAENDGQLIANVVPDINPIIDPNPNNGGIQWALCSAECQPTNTSPGLWLPAGDYGTFYFGPEPPESCSAAPCTQGLDPQPALYPPPGAAPPAYPCSGQGCFSCSGVDCLSATPVVPANPVPANFSKATAPAIAPWIAIIDFDGWHGETVGWVALQTTDPSVEATFLPLDTTTSGAAGVTDADLIRNLAALAEAIYREEVVPPLAINMSFGRLALPGDAQNTNCVTSNLSCQVSRLLWHLTKNPVDPTLPPRTLAVASAGNHQSLLFPASISHVLAAGSLDLAVYAQTGGATESWETPQPDAGSLPALMPGSALCIPWLGGPGVWAVPSGTSFATAITTGMLVDALLAHGDDVRNLLFNGLTWYPKLSGDSSNRWIELAQGEASFKTLNQGATNLINYTLDGDLSLCEETWKATDTVTTTMVPESSPPYLRLPSLVESVAATLRPTPEPDTCVPCSMTCEESFFGSIASISRGALASSKKVAVQPQIQPQVAPFVPPSNATVTLTVDLHAGWQLERNTVVTGLYLRYGPQDFKVNLTGPQLAKLTRGQIETLEIKGQVNNPALITQPSLISVLRHKDPIVGPIEYWHSTPMPMRDPEP